MGFEMRRNLIPSKFSEAAGGWLVKEICTGSSFSSLTSDALSTGIVFLADDGRFACCTAEKEPFLLARHVQEIHSFLGFIKNTVFNNISSVTDGKEKTSIVTQKKIPNCLCLGEIGDLCSS